jgi:uncharacterized membrane protein YecN with MAPEG domain
MSGQQQQHGGNTLHVKPRRDSSHTLHVKPRRESRPEVNTVQRPIRVFFWFAFVECPIFVIMLNILFGLIIAAVEGWTVWTGRAVLVAGAVAHPI